MCMIPAWLNLRRWTKFANAANDSFNTTNWP
jgi:hypothetical protein